MFENKDDLIIHEHEDHINRTWEVINGDEKRDDQESLYCISFLDDQYADAAHDLEDYVHRDKPPGKNPVL
jgi:hypothetical protein